MNFPSINDLPEEMMEKIFKKLDYKSLCSARETCKFWMKIIDERKVMEKALGENFKIVQFS